MNTHESGPFAVGQGAILATRAIRLDFNSTAGDTTLGTVEVGADTNPLVKLEVEVVTGAAFNGTGASIVVKSVNTAGTIVTRLTATITADATSTKKFLVRGRDRVYVTFTPGTTATTGDAIVSLTGHGRGQPG